jgi:hypothetical protein
MVPLCSDRLQTNRGNGKILVKKTLDWTFGVEAGYYWGLMGIIYYIIACRVSSKVLGTSHQLASQFNFEH